MSPFQHFRSWLRSGPTGERALTAATGLVLVALVAWASTPDSSGPASRDTLAAPAAQAVPTATAASNEAAQTSRAVDPAAGPRSSAVLPGTTPVVGSAGPRPSAVPGVPSNQRAPAAGGCGAQTATDSGVTATTITVGVVVVDLGAANDVIAVPPVGDQEKAYRTAFAALNAHGGVRCRTVVTKFYRDNPLDSSGEHALCLQMQQDKVFAVLNNLYTSTEQTCVARLKIPNVWYTPPHTGDVHKYGPYILSWQPDFDKLVHQYVFGAKAQGFFAGMKKLGILEGSCFPDEKVALVKELKAAGFDPSNASTFNYGCTGAPALQADQSAALQFQREGVTHVLNVAYTYDGTFAKAGDQQNYRPKYAHMDDSSASSMESANTKPGNSFDGALLITTGETGANNTPGYVFNKATKDCVAMLAKAGLPNATAGTGLLSVACTNATLFAAAADNAPNLTRTLLATGLSRSGRLELAYPAGPVEVTDPSLPTAGFLARPGRWATSCHCWKVIDARYRHY